MKLGKGKIIVETEEEKKYVAFCAASAAGNRSKRQHGRECWNEDDRNAAAAEYRRVYIALHGEFAEEMQKEDRCHD